ncbi:glycosyl hydrolase family 2 [Frondihabitans sp. PhB188]|uniref:glycoside hydrolase family 2 TIM barrel-domain containing protein n=1 Tax=Frondihabitans sp. PhB188 TaxID=2485200 RepID=UPI000F492F49|nr:glycoside hydrolase family 2 TIM barrel-domain containing protein [Frondihabitans sp. PhB188]ROQ38492.1 glycosyl hydrolase family 2 [Frondihabitans sp. PhB188]
MPRPLLARAIATTAALALGTAALVAAQPAAAATTGVHVTGTTGHWSLTVDGQPYAVKGVTYDPKVNAPAKYLPDVHAMGANTVRDWGTDISSTTHDLFTAAEDNHLRVIAGFWIDYGQDWTTNSAYQSQMISEITKTVTFYKNSDAVLMWDVGNEVMQNLPSSAQRAAYAKFIEKAAKAIHKADPDHPVTSTDSQTSFWPAYEKYAPSLDLFALNTYGGITSVKKAWGAGTYTKPYILTEAGTDGYWEVPADRNGQPTQPSDAAAAADYTAAWKAIVGDPGVALGGTMFHYSNETDQNAIWFGLRPGDLKRASYYALVKAWGGSVGANRPPVVSQMKFSTYAVKAGKTFILAAPATDPDRDAIAYAITRTPLAIGANGIPPAAHATKLTPGRYTVKAPATPGVYRFYARVSDGHGNADYESRTIRVTR